LLLNRIKDIDLVRGAGNLAGLHFNTLKETEPLKTHLGVVDQRGRRRTALHLAHFAAQHFIAGLGIATEFDAPHIGALARIDKEGDLGGFVFVLNLGEAFNLGKGITFVTKAADDAFVGAGHQLLGERIALLEPDQTTHFGFRNHQVASQSYLTDRIHIALDHIDRDIHRLLVGADGHLCGVNGKFEITAIQVPGLQFFQITGEFFPGIFVIAGNP